MQLNKMLKNDRQLLNLIEKAQFFQKLDKEMKRLLPPNLAAHFRVVCIDEQGDLVLYVSGGMAASRLKMLLPSLLPRFQQINEQILGVKISVRPQQVLSAKEKNCHLNQYVVKKFAQTAQKVKHHQALHDALCQLVKHHS